MLWAKLNLEIDVRALGVGFLLALAILTSLSMVTRSEEPSTCFAALQGASDFWVIRSRWMKTRHPLIARVHKVGSPFVPAEDLSLIACPENFTELAKFAGGFRYLDAKTIVLLGETHDNAEHHIVQAQFAAMVRKEPVQQPASSLVLEQISNQDGLDAFYRAPNWKAHGASLDELKSALEWNDSSWSKYYYDPIFQAALYARLMIYAGDVPRTEIMKVAKGGPEALPEDERKRLALDIPLGKKNDAASLAEIEDSHCGALPKEALAPMAFAQRYRDASLADATLRAAAKHGSAILITGNEHARTDRGVPWYIRQRAPDKKVISVMLIEVEDGKNDPEDYVPRDADGKPAADYIIFTPRAEHEDQCAKMRAKMGK